MVKKGTTHSIPLFPRLLSPRFPPVIQLFPRLPSGYLTFPTLVTSYLTFPVLSTGCPDFSRACHHLPDFSRAFYWLPDFSRACHRLSDFSRAYRQVTQQVIRAVHRLPEFSRLATGYRFFLRLPFDWLSRFSRACHRIAQTFPALDPIFGSFICTLFAHFGPTV